MSFDTRRMDRTIRRTDTDIKRIDTDIKRQIESKVDQLKSNTPQVFILLGSDVSKQTSEFEYALVSGLRKDDSLQVKTFSLVFKTDDLKLIYPQIYKKYYAKDALQYEFLSILLKQFKKQELAVYLAQLIQMNPTTELQSYYRQLVGEMLSIHNDFLKTGDILQLNLYSKRGEQLSTQFKLKSLSLSTEMKRYIKTRMEPKRKDIETTKLEQSTVPPTDVFKLFKNVYKKPTQKSKTPVAEPREPLSKPTMLEFLKRQQKFSESKKPDQSKKEQEDLFKVFRDANIIPAQKQTSPQKQTYDEKTENTAQTTTNQTSDSSKLRYAVLLALSGLAVAGIKKYMPEIKQMIKTYKRSVKRSISSKRVSKSSKHKMNRRK